jgi:hypothetical protein
MLTPELQNLLMETYFRVGLVDKLTIARLLTNNSKTVTTEIEKRRLKLEKKYNNEKFEVLVSYVNDFTDLSSFFKVYSDEGVKKVLLIDLYRDLKDYELFLSEQILNTMQIGL